MKKSEIREMIKEELLKEAKRGWPIKDSNDTMLKTSNINTDVFEIVQKDDDGGVNTILVSVEDISLFIKAFQNIQRKIGN